MPLHFPEQRGLFQDPFPNRRRGVSPSGVQLPGFPTGELVLRKGLGHAGAVLGAGTSHGHQEFHGHMSRDGTTAHLLLHAFREQLHQGQAVRYPTHTAIKPAGQLLQAVAEALFEFDQQPAFFQSAVAFRPTQRAIQDQCFGFAQGPDHGLDRIAAELFQGRNALVTVNDQIAVGLVGHRHDDDGGLLSRASQGGQQLPLPLRIAHAQKFITAIQLMKFQLHSRWSLQVHILQRAGSGIAPMRGEVCWEVLMDQRDRP